MHAMNPWCSEKFQGFSCHHVLQYISLNIERTNLVIPETEERRVRTLPVKLVIALKPSTQHFALLPVALTVGGRRRRRFSCWLILMALISEKSFIARHCDILFQMARHAACGRNRRIALPPAAHFDGGFQPGPTGEIGPKRPCMLCRAWGPGQVHSAGRRGGQ